MSAPASPASTPSPAVERPALLDVLSVLTATAPEHLTTRVRWPGEYLEGVACCRETCDKSCWGGDGTYLWQIKDPREALEALTTAGVLPESWAQDERRWFDGGHTELERGVPWPHPRTLPELVAWASLGRDAIMRAEALARETMARLKEWDAPQPDRVVWRVGECKQASRAVLMVKSSGLILTAAGFALPFATQAPIQCVADMRTMGLSLDSITADAITLTVPPIGGVQ